MTLHIYIYNGIKYILHYIHNKFILYIFYFHIHACMYLYCSMLNMSIFLVRIFFKCIQLMSIMMHHHLKNCKKQVDKHAHVINSDVTKGGLAGYRPNQMFAVPATKGDYNSIEMIRQKL